MKFTKLAGLAAALAIAGNVSASPLEIDYANINGSYITFNGNSTFDFTPLSGANLNITSGTDAGHTGAITGTYTIGAVTTVAGFSSASVTGSGLLTISSTTGNLTATVTWVDIDQFGTGLTLNTGGTVDLTGISYSGTNPDLVALANGHTGVNVVTFQFAPAVSLSALKSGFHQTSFSGSITQPVPDNGTTVALLGGAMLLIGGIRRKIKA